MSDKPQSYCTVDLPITKRIQSVVNTLTITVRLYKEHHFITATVVKHRYQLSDGIYYYTTTLHAPALQQENKLLDINIRNSGFLQNILDARNLPVTRTYVEDLTAITELPVKVLPSKSSPLIEGLSRLVITCNKSGTKNFFTADNTLLKTDTKYLRDNFPQDIIGMIERIVEHDVNGDGLGRGGEFKEIFTDILRSSKSRVITEFADKLIEQKMRTGESGVAAAIYRIIMSADMNPDVLIKNGKINRDLPWEGIIGKELSKGGSIPRWDENAMRRNRFL